MLIPAQHVKPFVRGNKNDANDAIAILEASYRPNLRPVPIKKLFQQDLQLLLKAREMRVQQRTQLINQIRGFLSNYGVIISPSRSALITTLPSLLEDASNALTPVARTLAYQQLLDIKALTDTIESLETQLSLLAAEQPAYKLIQTIPGIGPIIAAYFVASIDVHGFKKSRDLSAYLGLVPKSYASGDKVSHGGISKRGNQSLRTLLIHGARTVIRWSEKHDDSLRRWVIQVDKRIGRPKSTVALANKLCRIAWAVLRYEQPFASQLLAPNATS